MKNGSKAKKILIIEDEKPLATALVLKLQKQGHTVTVAHDGKMAVELMARELYDVALLDLIMPIMDGFEVLKAARKLPAVPVFIVLSNLTQPDDTSRVTKLGARKFLVKSDTSLASVVKEIEAL
jgi:DNA-binding response OmpR family regulator